MNQIYQSTALHALGWAIAGSLWQMALLWMAYQLVIAIPFRKKPAVKYTSAVVFMVSGSIWFLLHFVQQYRFILNEVPARNNTTASLPANGWVSLLRPETLSGLMEAYIPYFSAAYLLILVFLGTRLMRKILLTSRMYPLSSLTPAGEWQAVVDDICERLSLPIAVSVYFSEEILVPVTLGILRPVILLPLASVNQLSVSQVEAILLHEIAHIRRHDFLLNIVVSTIEILLFFNPFVHLLGLSVRKERELCCDDFVLRCQRNPQDYAFALLSLEKSRQSASFALAASGNQTQLLDRVKRILNIPEHPVYFRYRVLALFVLAGLLLLLTHLKPVDNHMLSQDDKAVSIAGINSDARLFSLPFAYNDNGPGPIRFSRPESRFQEQGYGVPADRRPLAEKIQHNKINLPGKHYPAPLASQHFLLQTPETAPERIVDDRSFSFQAPPLPPVPPIPPVAPGQRKRPDPASPDMIVKPGHPYVLNIPDLYYFQAPPASQESMDVFEEQARAFANDLAFSNEQKKIREITGLFNLMKKRSPVHQRENQGEDQPEAMGKRRDWPIEDIRDEDENDLLQEFAISGQEGITELKQKKIMNEKNVERIALQNLRISGMREKMSSARKQPMPAIITEDGVTIRIIQDAQQIEITVKNKR